ncbi:MAG: type I-C CRISPR-associated protein Cas7/Csd2 [Alphaproteobacteria bacterium]|nr:type I-C CRISPR-associated protein Cas7/Csd2 [Alphaproteobacteria bacterium]
MTTLNDPIRNRYEFVYLFDVELGNPNGDPDAGNMPRIDYQTNHGLVTDVCLKRKVRNFVELVREDAAAENGQGLEIYVREKAVLNRAHERAYQALSIESTPKKLPKEEEKARELTRWMCRNFYDIRTFGAVMATEVNCGQVRGPVQLAFAKSVDPIRFQEISITRMAVTNEKDLASERTMGRKAVVPYALYRAEGFVSAPLAERTGFSELDLDLLWKALINMWDHDRSAARGKMCARRLIVFRHDGRLGNAPAHLLFDAVKVRASSSAPAICWTDYAVSVDEAAIPPGVSMRSLL